VQTGRLLRNNTAQAGDLLFLTKPLGVGIITTAEKMGKAKPDDLLRAIANMTTLNKIGERLGEIKGVHAVTDVTGFGLFGHLLEMAEGSNLAAELNVASLPELTNLDEYMNQFTIPAITYRNWNSYGHLLTEPDARTLHLGCDPQTSGGLLIAIAPEDTDALIALMKSYQVIDACLKPIGKLKEKEGEKWVELV
jgi:selenide, water dikinase